MSENLDELFDFPCPFPIKAMGHNLAGFAELVLEIVARHCAGQAPLKVEQRPSSNGKYISITVTITAHNRAQLDAIYQALTDETRVLMAL